MGFADYSTALQMRQVIRDMVKEEVERIRPRYQLATVQSFDRINRKCTIRYNGETSDVEVNMGSVQPSAIGQIVRIDGLLGDRFIAEVLGTAYQPLEDRVATLESDPAAAAVFNVNPGFELGLSGWSNFWATGGANFQLEVNSPDAYSGANCASVVIDADGDSGVLQTAPYPVQPGEPLYLSFAVKWDGNGTPPVSKLEIQMAADEANANYFGSGVVYSAPIPDLAVTTDYQFREIVYIVPAGVNYARFSVRVNYVSPSTTSKTFVDQVRFQRLVFPDSNDPTTFDNTVTANGLVYVNDNIILPALDGSKGLQGWGGRQYDILRRFGGIGLKWDSLRHVSSTGVKWDNRAIVIGWGKDTSIWPGGHLSLYMPANSTSIPVNGGAGTAVTVASGEIPLSGWRALYYAPTWTENTASNDSGWQIVDHQVSNFMAPQHWILVASRINGGAVKWGDGREDDYWRAPTLTNSWVNYGSGYDDCYYTKANGICYIVGMIRDGTIGSGTDASAFTLPAGYRPEPGGRHLFACPTTGGMARVDIDTAGLVRIVSGTTWVGLSGISFKCEA